MHTNVDLDELAKFDDFSQNWWDLNGEFKMLHKINSIRLNWVSNLFDFNEKKILDIGCGGGILTEGLAKLEARATGIDLSASALKCASEHASSQALKIQYQLSSAEDFATNNSKSFDAITCMEMLEHVPDPIAIIKAATRLVKPNGWVFFSTINRNLKSYLLAILGAEYILKMLPRGTHDYSKFIRPSELTNMCRECGLNISHLKGMVFNVVKQEFVLSDNVDVNYFLACQRVI